MRFPTFAVAALSLAVGALPAAGPVGAQATPGARGAQAAPGAAHGTDIWIADVRRKGSDVELRRLRRVTNADGYHNQPAFTPDGRALLFSAAPRGAAGAPPDVYRYDVAKREAARLTNTPESEYSPAPVPGGVQFTVVRVERDSAQRLWRLDGEGLVVTPVLPRERRVAYYAWADSGRMVLALLDSAVGGALSLFVAETGTGRLLPVARNVGRSIQRIPGRGTVSFVQRDSAGASRLVALDPTSRSTARLLRLPGGAEHHAWLPDGTVLAGTPRGLASATPGPTAARWHPVELPANAPLLAITRVAVSPRGDRVAFVAERR